MKERDVLVEELVLSNQAQLERNETLTVQNEDLRGEFNEAVRPWTEQLYVHGDPGGRAEYRCMLFFFLFRAKAVRAPRNVSVHCARTPCTRCRSNDCRRL